MADNHLNEIYSASPASIYKFLHELVDQNAINAEKGFRKFAGMLIGSPGIGKTNCVEDFPLHHLAMVNNEIAASLGAGGFEFHYRHFNINNVKFENDERAEFEAAFPKGTILNCFHLQAYQQLEKTGHSKTLKKAILDAINYNPLVEVIEVRQSDIIVPEDISGLPSSDSDLNRILTITNILEKYKDDEEAAEYLEIIKEKALVTARLSLKGATSENNDLRNTSKFDYTEWEKKVWDIKNDKPWVKHIVLLLDDITRAANNNTSILNVLMPLFQEGMVGQRALPDICSVIITSNEADSDDGGVNYVLTFDQAQSDRLFTKKITFHYNDWEQHALSHDVHESVILFLKHNQKIVKDGMITPRRLTQLGQALFNRFSHKGKSEDIITNKPESNEKLMQTLYMHLGDSKNENYPKIMNMFISFLRTIAGQTAEFIEELLKNGWSAAAKNRIEKMRNEGDTVKLMIITHKVNEIIFKNELSDKQEKGVIDFFLEDGETSQCGLPFNLRFSMLNNTHEWTNLHHKLMQGNVGKDQKKVYDQVNRILRATAKSLGVARNEKEKGAIKELDDFKKKNK